jgi:hypothetical protein
VIKGNNGDVAALDLRADFKSLTIGFMKSPTMPNWTHLAPKTGSVYRQLFVKGRNIAARTLYGAFMSDEEPRTVEQIARDWGLPLEVVQEAIAYCQSNPPEIHEDWRRERANIAAYPVPKNRAPRVPAKNGSNGRRKRSS